MINWSSSWSASIKALCVLVTIGQFTRAADFVVTSRADVLLITSKIQATQFLTHATFGPTEAEIEALAAEMRDKGTIQAASEWIDRQTDESQTPGVLHLPTLKSIINTDLQFVTVSPTATPTSYHAPQRTRYRQFAWWNNVIAGPDQLRQKMAWALAQICAVGRGTQFDAFNLDSTVTNGPINQSRYIGITDYYDIFVKNAFANYREVVGRVTFHPVMGDWLSFRGNRRAQSGSAPDENYAREVMQLFTIGLDLLGDDGEQQRNAQGVIPTYDADDIREYAQVFTGLGYGYGTLLTTSTAFSPYSGTTSANPNASIKYGVPMRMAPSQHDRSVKNLLNGLNLPNPNGEGTAFPTSIAGENQANADINQALDGLIAHQSCPPFIVNRLILRLVKSNPSKSYMNRVVQVFKNNGSGVRGDLKAVVKAILLDPEAFQPIRVQYQRSPSNKIVVTTMGTEDSRLQEPCLNYTRFIRYFKGTAIYEKANAGSYTNATVLSNEFRLGTRFAEFAQSPYEMPTVFNFYNADFQPRLIVNAPLSSRIPNNTAVAPEFEIINAITANRTANWFRDRIVAGNRTENHLVINRTSSPGNTTVTETESTRCRVLFNFSSEQALATTPAGIDALLERLDLYLCGGTLSDQYKTRLRAALISEINTAGGVGNVSSGEALNIAKAAILAIYSSPNFMVTE